MSILGTRVVRTEDPRLLTVGGTYVDDLRVPELSGAARVTFVRSPIAHALITGIDVEEARQAPGVVAVLTAADIDDLAPPPPPGEGPLADGGGEAAPLPLGGPWMEPLLAVDRVRFVGEPVAIVVCEDSYSGAPADAGAFADCEVVVERTIMNQRLAPMPMEGRAVAACWADGKLTVWVSTQNAQISRFILAGVFGLDPASIRVVAPDVGGGFGAKIGIDRDGLIVAWAAKHIGRALRWAETRSENLVAMTHGRDQRHAIKIGGSRDGRIKAYRLDVVQNAGAFPRMGGFLPFLTKLMAAGPYDIKHVETASREVVTNTTPINAYRGAGRPEATAAIERAVDLFAAEVGMDPAEVRRTNLVTADRFPYQSPSGPVYDSGDYVSALDKVLAGAGYQELRAEQARRRERGDTVQLGLGISVYVEITAGDMGGETARVVIDGTGAATVFTGSSAHGQGHHTAWAMLVQDELGIPMES